MINKILGITLGVGVTGFTALSAFAVAPTSFSTTSASSILDTGYDLFVDMIGAIATMLLPVLAVVGFVYAIWRLVKKITRPKI